MATKLHQILAVLKNRKTLAETTLGSAYKQCQTEVPFEGIARTYQPVNDEGEKLPSETKNVQITVRDAVQSVRDSLVSYMDTVCTQEQANTNAKANISVDGEILATDVPVSALLFLEKRVTDLVTFVGKLPITPLDRSWVWNKDRKIWESKPVDTAKTKKISKVLVKYEATKEHPAQTEMVTEDIVAGYWTTIHFSGAISPQEKSTMLFASRKLLEAIKKAREEANSTEVIDMKVGDKILDYVFNTIA